PLPVLGAVPGSAAPWAIALLLLTALAIGFIGVKRRPNFLQAAVSGIAAGIIVLVFGYFVAGELGYYEAVRSEEHTSELQSPFDDSVSLNDALPISHCLYWEQFRDRLHRGLLRYCFFPR